LVLFSALVSGPYIDFRFVCRQVLFHVLVDKYIYYNYQLHCIWDSIGGGFKTRKENNEGDAQNETFEFNCVYWLSLSFGHENPLDLILERGKKLVIILTVFCVFVFWQNIIKSSSIRIS
jgi:hypothetical protein